MAEDRFTDYGRGDPERGREREWRGARPGEGRGEDRSFGAERGYSRQGGYGEYGGDYARQEGESARGADFERGYARYGGYGGYAQDGGYGGFGQAYAYGGRRGGAEGGYGQQGFGRAQQSFRGRGPKGYRRSDERIREDANDRLADDHWLDASEIEVEVSNCEVTLSGSVASREDKRRAESLIEQVSGVEHVQNNLRVQTSNQPGQSGQVADQAYGLAGEGGRA